MKKGFFIVLEGADGSGKSTHARLLAEYLESKGRDVVVTQEPTKGFIGQAIRRALSGKMEVSPKTLALFFTADRCEHVEQVIRPALAAGKAVITDRYYYSTIAYQAVQGVSPKWVSELNSFVPEPDLVLILKIDTDKALSRISAREKEVFEVRDFQEKVQKNLLDLASGEHKNLSKPGKSWRVVDSNGRPEDVQKKIREAVDEHL
jgi:dTMP kinase